MAVDQGRECGFGLVPRPGQKPLDQLAVGQPSDRANREQRPDLAKRRIPQLSPPSARTPPDPRSSGLPYTTDAEPSRRVRPCQKLQHSPWLGGTVCLAPEFFCALPSDRPKRSPRLNQVRFTRQVALPVPFAHVSGRHTEPSNFKIFDLPVRPSCCGARRTTTRRGRAH